VAILCGLAGTVLIAWVYLLLEADRMEASMAGGAMGGGMTQAMGGAMMQLRPWSAVDFALMFAMWAVMMVGMMVPSAAPMALVYAAVARKASRQGESLAPTAVFVTGYVVMWTLFSAGATLLQWGLERAALLSPMMVSTSPALGGGLLIAAGVYQLTPLKDACLRHCRSPAYFISEHWRPGRGGAFRMGLLAADGHPLLRRGDEPAVDRRHHALRSAREGGSGRCDERTPGRPGADRAGDGGLVASVVGSERFTDSASLDR
jgi:predicted metal-binding membrane protein